MFCFVLGFVSCCVLFEMVDPWSQWEVILLMSNHFHKETCGEWANVSFWKFSPFCEKYFESFFLDQNSLFWKKIIY
jgi:hypothetical protein